MDLTVPRNYPYPECDVPLTEDASDIVQVANLALTIDADVQTLFNSADNNLLSPDGCALAATVSQVINQGDPLVWDTSRFDNTPGTVMGETGGIRVRQDGTYLVSYWVRISTAVTLRDIKVVSSVEGLGELVQEGLGANFNTTTLPGQASGSVIYRLISGQLNQLSARTVGTGTLTVLQAEMSAVRMGPL